MRVWLVLATAAVLAAQTPPVLTPGPLTDGSELLATGWRIHPAGTQVATGEYPLASALSPDGRYLAIANSGSPSSVQLLRTDTMAQVARVPVPEAWQGIVFAPDGRNVYVSGGA